MLKQLDSTEDMMRYKLANHVCGLGAALLVSATMAGAQPAGPPRNEGHGGKEPDRIARYLGLSAQQQTQLRQVFEKQQPQAQALGKQAHENERQMREALNSLNPDPTTVGELAIQGHRLREEGRKLRDAADQAFRALLMPAQQVKFDAMRALQEESGPAPGFGGHRDGPMDPGPGFGPPPDEPPSLE